MNSSADAMFWSPDENKSVRCGLCPHRCSIFEDTAGLCGIRENRSGRLLASGYGAVSSVALDPIEKKPLNLFYPGSKILSIGGFGCNLRCRFCQNYEISMGLSGNPELTMENMRRNSSSVMSPEEIVELAVQTSRIGNIGIAYTYNEPLINYEFLLDCAKLVREEGLKNVIVTNGYINLEPLETLLPLIDAMNIDLKGFSDGFYMSVGGSLEPVMETICHANEKCHVEVTTLVIPGENDGDIDGIAGWLSSINPDIPLHLSRFLPRYKYYDKDPTPKESILSLCDTAKKYLNNVFAGNI